MLIDIRQLTLDYVSEAGVVKILRGIDFKVQRGEKLAICGPSGSGKSTLLYILGGLLRPTGGEVRLEDRELWHLTEPERCAIRAQQIGFVFQQFHLIPGWTVLQNIMLPSEYNPIPDAEGRARELIKKLGLAGLEDRKPNQLSGGQAQRVAIGRALLMDPEILLADEPTGSLDSKTAREILELFDLIHQEGKTVILITHDEKIASLSERVIRVEDGKIASDSVMEKSMAIPVDSDSVTAQTRAPKSAERIRPPLKRESPVGRTRWALDLMKDLFHNYSWTKSLELLKRNPSRSFLTLFGIAVGVAAVVSMISIGGFAKEKILQSYSTLGVRNFQIWGYPNWQMSASEPVTTYFRAFNIDRDILPLMRLFPEIKAYSPLVRFWSAEVSYGGKTLSNDTNLMGLGADGLRLNDFTIAQGRPLTSIDIEERLPVCWLGKALVSELRIPVDDTPMIFVKTQLLTFACRVVGSLNQKSAVGGGRSGKPGYEIIAPFSFLQAIRGESLYSNEGDMNQILFEVIDGTLPDDVTSKIEKHFEQKYGSAGSFQTDTNAKVVGQMQKFLNIFNILLTSIAFITLLVGATGVTNMILVSISERIRELGIRRAVGAEPKHLRRLVLSESLTLCGIAGLLGIVAALVFEHGMLYLVSKIFKQVPFEWLWDPLAMIISLVSIIGVGIGSGLYPALKVERQDVVKALRTD